MICDTAGHSVGDSTCVVGVRKLNCRKLNLSRTACTCYELMRVVRLISQAADELKAKGARRVFAYATHGNHQSVMLHV